MEQAHYYWSPSKMYTLKTMFSEELEDYKITVNNPKRVFTSGMNPIE